MALAIGTPAQRAAALASDADVVVMNYDNIQTLTAADMARFDGVGLVPLELCEQIGLVGVAARA